MKRDAIWVLVIVAVVALGVAVAEWRKEMTDRDALAECEKNLKNLGTAMEMYSTDNGGRFPLDTARMGGPYAVTAPLRLPQALVPNFLKTMPTCPAIGTDTYSNSSLGEFGPDAYTIVCGGHHHAGVGQGPNYPQYTSVYGLLTQ